jgi:hypothetical protein
MPEDLQKRLQRGEPTTMFNRIGRDGRICVDRIVENEVSGLVPIIARLCETSPNLQKAYLCHPSVQHVFKGPKQSHFCGYRNIQMLISFIQGSKVKNCQHFGKKLPGILDIQQFIEDAWDGDVGSFCRQETGGILNTRKWIGTPEVSISPVCQLPY